MKEYGPQTKYEQVSVVRNGNVEETWRAINPVDHGPIEIKHEDSNDIPTEFAYGGDLTPIGGNGWRDKPFVFDRKVGKKPYPLDKRIIKGQ